MKIARARLGRRSFYGQVQGNELVELRGNLFGRYHTTGTRYRLSDVKLLPPTQPTQIWCPGLNFLDHLATSAAVGGHATRPEHPEPWHKGVNGLIGHEDYIVIPKDSSGNVHYEGELVAVIGRPCRRVSPSEALGYVLGYTCGNDVSERDWQRGDRYMWRAKGSDTFCPVGPWIETDLDPRSVGMMVRLNGRQVAKANTHDMIFAFANIISHISQQVTLKPGDLVFSGTTGETSAMRPGDVVEVEMEGVGTLRNYVKLEQ
ncbi:MAG: fumarylacetoacetate hydrolase family protein [Chloroflexota bacterium]|nr:fumarylacetoacetate hydrolase family protein [Chloroflexota bacterium]